MARTFTLEKMFQIWDDSCGTRVEVGPDPDGLDLIELRYVDENNKAGARITLVPQEAKLVVAAMTELLSEIDKKEQPK